MTLNISTEHSPTVAYLTKVCRLVIIASTAIFSKYWLVIIAMVGCLAASTFGICLTTVTSSWSACTLVKLFRLCSRALIFLSNWSSEMRTLI